MDLFHACKISILTGTRLLVSPLPSSKHRAAEDTDSDAEGGGLLG